MLEFVVGFITLLVSVGVCFIVGMVVTRGEDPEFGEVLASGILISIIAGVAIAVIIVLSFAIGAAIMGTL